MVEPKNHIRLSELARRINNAINNEFGNDSIWIVAEISNHKYYQNNSRHYFEFIEKSENSDNPVTKLKGVAWTTGSESIQKFEKSTGQQFQNGIEVLASVSVSFHEVYGLSLVLNEIDLSFTLGKLEQLRHQTLLRLLEKNPDAIQLIGDEYITKNKKQQLPRVIQKIAVIGSNNSEGIVDFEHTLSNNDYGYKFAIDYYYSSVQGLDASHEMVERLIKIYKSPTKYDCIVIARGGGSKSDFQTFDSYDLSRAVARINIPVITGIGHQRDNSIVDMMAHTSTKTPTKAAEFIVFINAKFEEKLLLLQKRLTIKTQQILATSKAEISNTNYHLVNRSRDLLEANRKALTTFYQVLYTNTMALLYDHKRLLLSKTNQLLNKPVRILAEKSGEIRHEVNLIKLYTKKYLQLTREYLGHYNSIILLLDPQKLLKRGYAIIEKNNQIITDSASLKNGDHISIRMEKHILESEIKQKRKIDE